MTKPDALGPSEIRPLSPIQTYFAGLRGPGAIIAARWDIRGAVPTVRVQSALQSVVTRHEILRTRLVAPGGHAGLDPFPSVDVKLGDIDLRPLPIEDRNARVDEIEREFAARPIDPSVPPLFRACFLRLTSERAVMILAGHRAVFDDPALDLLAAEVERAIYAKGPRMLPPAPQAIDATGDQRCRAASGGSQEDLAYWRRTLSGYRPLTAPSSASGPAARLRRPLPPRFDGRLAEAARRTGVDRETFGLTAIVAALSAMTGRSDIAVALESDGRTRPGATNLLGPFTDTLMIRMRTAPGLPLPLLLHMVQDARKDAHSHKDCTIDAVNRAVLPAQRGRCGALDDVSFRMHRRDMARMVRAATHVTPALAHLPGLRRKIEISLIGTPTVWELVIDYDAAVMTKDGAGELASLAKLALYGVMGEAGIRLSDLATEGQGGSGRPKPSCIAGVPGPSWLPGLPWFGRS